MRPDRQCVFPSWLRPERALLHRTLDGAHRLEFTAEGKNLQISKLNHATGVFQIIYDVQCVEEISNNVTAGVFIAEALSTEDW